MYKILYNTGIGGNNMKKGNFYTLEDYIITEEGKIINKHNNHILKPQPNAKGYLRVNIGGKRYFVHRLVAEKYIKNPNNYEQVNHINGNKEDNYAKNLEWVNNDLNRKHAVKSGLHLCGEKCSYAKLTEENVMFIRKNLNISNSVLSKMFNVSPSTIRSVKKYETWKHLKRYAEL